VLTVSEEPHSELYWKKYIYSVTIIQPNLSSLRHGYEIKDVDTAVAHRKYWESKGVDYAISFTDSMVADLYITAEFFRNLDADHRLVFYSGDRCYLYTNSEELVESLQLSECVTVVSVKKRVVVLPQDTIMLVDPTHQFRTYFKSRQFTDKDAVTRLVNWLNTQEQAGEITMSLSLKYWSFTSIRTFNRPYYTNRTRDYWYVNHNNKTYETMINLVYPGLVRKTVSLQRR